MARGLPSINLKLATATSALTVLRTLLVDAMHEDDRGKLEELIGRAEAAIDEASEIMNNIRNRLENAIGQL